MHFELQFGLSGLVVTRARIAHKNWLLIKKKWCEKKKQKYSTGKEVDVYLV